MNWRAAALRGIDRETRGLQRGNKAARTIQRLVRKFLKTDYHHRQKRNWRWERLDKEIKKKRMVRQIRENERKYRTSVRSHSAELKRNKWYLLQEMNRIEDKADREWEDFGRRPGHFELLDDYDCPDHQIYPREYGNRWYSMEQDIEELDDRIWELDNS